MSGHFDALKNKILASRIDSPERIAIIIKTINRKHLLFLTLESIFDYADAPFRLYIGDDGDIDEEQSEIYSVLQQAGHFVCIYDKPTPFTAALNDLVKATEGEQFILRMDDDFAFCPDTRLEILREILLLVPCLGAISGAERNARYQNTAISEGELSKKQGFVIRDGSTLYRLNVPIEIMQYAVVSGHRFCVVGHARNFLLLRRGLLNEMQWNEELIFSGERTDLFLRMANSGWLVGFTPDSIHLHVQDGIPTSTYTGRSEDLELLAKENLFWRDYGIKEVKGIDLTAVARGDKRQGLKRNLNRLRISLTRLAGRIG